MKNITLKDLCGLPEHATQAILALARTVAELEQRQHQPHRIAPEEWRPVIDWEDCYEVSNHGRVRSLDRIRAHDGVTMRGRLLKGDGRGRYTLVDGRNQVQRYGVDLAQEAFES